MKINCGPSPQERADMIAAGAHPRQQWREWFAWYPVRIASGDCRWFETIMKREHRWASWGETGWSGEYATIEDYNNKPAHEYYENK